MIVILNKDMMVNNKLTGNSKRLPMTQRTRRCLIAIAIAIGLGLFVIPAAFVLWQYLNLRSYQAFIHEHYSTEIEQLELAMQQWPADRFQDETTYQKIEALHAKLKQTFNSGDFYCAHWSYDSHHGMRGTGIPDSGYSTYTRFSTTSNLRQSLYYGKSFDGVPLLVYQRWLPNVPVMRHIQIVLYRDKVNQSMKAESASQQ